MSRRRPSLLIIINQPLVGCEGQVDGYRLLVETGELDFVETVSTKDSTDDSSGERAVARAVDALRKSVATHIMVWTPATFPKRPSDLDRIDKGIPRSSPYLLGRRRVGPWSAHNITNGLVA